MRAAPDVPSAASFTEDDHAIASKSYWGKNKLERRKAIYVDAQAIVCGCFVKHQNEFSPSEFQCGCCVRTDFLWSD